MAGFSGYYVELGQPIYAKSFFWHGISNGENRIEDQTYFLAIMLDTRLKT